MVARASIAAAAAFVGLGGPAWGQSSEALAPAAAVQGAPVLETSWRISAWSGTRLSDPNAQGVLTGEVWLRARQAVSEQLVFKLNAWASSDPVGTGEADIEVREAAIEAKFDQATLTLGRQLFVWGRADKINPTDVLGARNYRRLTDDDLDQRLGLLAVSATAPLAGGTISLHWVPEFRATYLPQSFERPGVIVRDLGASNPEQQFALRYERFGNHGDWSATIAQVADRIPWLNLSQTLTGQPELQLLHPNLTMIGADFASTLGKFGVRGEVAFYFYKASDLARYAARRPNFQAVLGIDRDFGNQLNVIVQAGVRLSDQVSSASGAIVDNNTNIQAAWRDSVGAAFMRVRKGLKDDRGSVEAALGAYQRGGTYASARLNLIIRDGVRLIVQSEHFSGPANSYFGRLSNNSLISITMRFGF
jgi:hypothetical protein